MQVVIVESAAEVGRLAAAEIGDLIRRRADAVLGLATGSSPLAVYAELGRQVHRDGLDWYAVRATRLVLVANGAHKPDPVARMVEGPVSSMCPASALQIHADATVIIDEQAAGRLTLTDYYRHTYEHLPAWQRCAPAPPEQAHRRPPR